VPDNDQPDTGLAPTEQASAETAELPPATDAGPELAWSIDDDTAEVEQTRHRGGPLVWSALVALVVAIAGALIFLGTTYFGSHDSRRSEPSAKPTPSMPTAAPSTVTVTAAPSSTWAEIPPTPTTIALAPTEPSAAP
jgi:hypothetical protein